MMIQLPAVKQVATSLTILFVCGGLFFGLTRMKDAPEQNESLFNPPVIEARTLKPEAVTLTINSQGMVTPAIETLLVAEVSGVVKSVSPVFVSGAVFKQGEVLAWIDDSDYKVALRQAEAKLTASRARLAEELAKSEAETKNWLRSGKKLKDAPDLLLRTPYVAEAKANVEAARALQDKAKRDLEKTRIKAPYDGMVKERLLNLGQFLSPGKEIASIFSVDFAEVRLPITPADLEFVDLPAIGRSQTEGAGVQLEQRLGRRTLSWEAVVDRVEGIVDQKNRMHFLVVKVSDPYGLQSPREVPLKSGSFVYAKLHGKTVDNLFRLPRTALYGSGQVLVLSHSVDGVEILRFRDVDIVYTVNTDVLVSGNIFEGDKICLTPLNNPIDGMQVNSGLPKGAAVDKKQAISLSKD